MSSANRRSNQRYPCETNVWLLEQDGSGDPLLVEVDNVSRGGFLCRVLEPLPIGKAFVLCLQLLQQAEMTRVAVEVRHVHPTENGEYAVGLMLTDVTNMTKRGFMASVEAMFS